MTIEKTDREQCSLGISRETLAAWHDTLLDPEEAQRISAHAPGCAACQARLNEYQRLDQVLRLQQLPAPTEHLWQDVQSNMFNPSDSVDNVSSANHGHMSRSLSDSQSNAQRRRQLLGSIGALAAAILVIVGFLRLFQTHAGMQGPTTKATSTTAKLLGTPTPLPTLGPVAPPVPGTPPNWQQQMLPVPYMQEHTALGLTAAPNAGTTAYLCYSANLSSSNQPQVWVTHDSGSQWTHVGNLPVPSQIDVAQCSLDVDAFDSSRVLALLSWQDINTFADHTDWFASSDGGANWAMIAQGQNFNIMIERIATNQGKTYAIYTTASPWPANEPTPTTLPNQPPMTVVQTESHLAVSSDGLHSWQPVDGPILALVGAKQSVKQFWAQVGADGQTNLLADFGNTEPSIPSAQTDTLWVSHDNGTHWTQLPAPQMQTFIAQTTADGHSRNICGITTGDSHQNYNHVVLACSTDGGQNWVARPSLPVSVCCIPSVNALSTVIASDGSLIDSYLTPAQHAALYRLPANSDQWQFLGERSASAYAMTQNGGVLWSYDIGQTATANGVFYTAAYPG